MHFLIGVATDEYVILASDKATFAYGAVLADDRISPREKLTMMRIGEEGDVAQFGDWTKRNIRLYAIRNGYELCPKSAHHWSRRGIAEALRTEDYYAVDVLLGGFDGIHLSHVSSETCLFLPSAARTFEHCSRDAHLNRPITVQQRTSRHAAPDGTMYSTGRARDPRARNRMFLKRRFTKIGSVMKRTVSNFTFLFGEYIFFQGNSCTITLKALRCQRES
ncbi:hypothetical protein Y032_1052g3498 [Ancylostoma ceylanicum]|nr:hypothetical protein Y032_1052g3498 [Ancylostoma ceylanicum]